MFLKLLKYDFKSIGKSYIFLNIVTIAVAFILGLTVQNIATYDVDYSSNMTVNMDILYFTLTIAFVVLLTALSISTLWLIIKRFSKNVFGREGYLTMTLPVSIHSILLSKLSVATLLTICNFFVMLVSLSLLFIPTLTWVEIHLSLAEIIPYLLSFNGFITIIFFLTSSISGVLMIYLSLAIGQLFHDKRRLMSLIAYFILFIVACVVYQIITNLLSPSLFIETWEGYYRNYLLLITGFTTASSILFYFGTAYILQNKLNLE